MTNLDTTAAWACGEELQEAASVLGEVECAHVDALSAHTSALCDEVDALRLALAAAKKREARMVEAAYMEGFEDRKAAQHCNHGGWTWPQSKARAALATAFLNLQGDPGR